MAYIPVRLDLFAGDRAIRKAILAVARDELNRIFQSIEQPVTDRIRIMLLESIKNSKEFQSLKDNTVGSLKGELGVVDADERINRLLQLWSKQFYFKSNKVKVTGNEQLAGGFNLGIIDDDYIEAGEIGSFISEYGHTVEWLRWLMLAGDSYVISNYKVMFGTEFERSRTGLAIMRRSAKSSYRVNPYYSGDINDNLITRAFSRMQQSLGKIIKDEIRRAM